MKSIFHVFVMALLFFSCTRKMEHVGQQYKFEPAETVFLAKQFPALWPDYEAMDQAHEMAKRKMDAGQRTDGTWTLQGPGNIGARINTIAMHPQQSNVIYAGFADGGLWKTTDGGANWFPVFENEVWQSIGSICIDPNDGNTVYVGTGDPNVSGYPRAGGGVYKSVNGGQTWQLMGLEATRIISRIVMPKNQPNTLYVSAMGTPFFKNQDKGVYKSTNGGQSWEQVLFINDSTGVSEIVIHPTNPNRLYAVGWNRVRNYEKSLVAGPDAKVFRTDDGGLNWTQLNNGLPNDIFTRMGICISESNPNVVYVQYTNASTLNLEAIYKSVDGGDSWTLHSQSNENGLPNNALGGFGWYFGKIRVNPKDENDLFLLGVGIYRYDANTNLWSSVNDDNAELNPHADKHDLIFRNDTLYLATDGGLYKTNINWSPNWVDIDNIPTTQFYRTAFNPHQPDLYYGGAQDNGTSSGNGSDINNWQRIFGGDGFQMAFRNDNPGVIYAETQNGNLAVSQDGGNTWSGAREGLSGSRHWDMQYIISSHNEDVMYTGTDKFYKSDAGIIPLWEAISEDLVDKTSNALIHQFTCLSESPLDAGVLYCGTSDAMVWNSTNGGASWTRITNGLPSRYISSIKASPALSSRVYVTLTGYKANDNTAHIYRSDNYGTTWTPIAGNLPPYAINDVLVYPNGLDDVLFVATDGGIYITIDAGDNWERLGSNMPLIPVFDMDYNPVNNELIAATFARGIQTFSLDQIGVGLETGTKETTLLWSVYPNVAHDVIEIKGESPETIEVYDIRGKLQIHLQKPTSIDISAYKPGIYFVKSGNKIQKFLKF